ncbi:hypothetical protein H2248_000527 [Termitomyces sp. 'cryptogamus']|nr:hypothetical protein H2248_000527 [Termitomyces sp. 'cryptogamus']
MAVEMVGDWDFVVSEGGSDEADAKEVLVGREEGGEETGCEDPDVDEEGEVAGRLGEMRDGREEKRGRTRVYMEGTWRLCRDEQGAREKRDDLLECNDDVALGRHRVRLFPVCSEVLVAPEHVAVARGVRCRLHNAAHRAARSRSKSHRRRRRRRRRLQQSAPLPPQSLT